MWIALSQTSTSLSLAGTLTAKIGPSASTTRSMYRAGGPAWSVDLSVIPKKQVAADGCFHDHRREVSLLAIGIAAAQIPMPEKEPAAPLALEGPSRTCILHGGIMKTLALIAATGLVGCAAGTALIKTPVEQKCAGYGLKGCGELVDGVVLYVNGDKDAAVLALKRGAAKNSPAQLRPFAGAIKTVISGDTGEEIAEILSGEIKTPTVMVVTAEATNMDGEVTAPSNAYRAGPQSSAAAPPQSAPPADRGETIATLAIAASVDPSRLVTGAASPLSEELRVQCDVLGKQGICSRQQAGPIVVTDATVPTGCQSEMFFGAVENSDNHTSWLVQANAPGIHGAKFFVRSDQRLLFAVRTSATTMDPRCVVTWAGFKPRIVPLAVAPTSAE